MNKYYDWIFIIIFVVNSFCINIALDNWISLILWVFVNSLCCLYLGVKSKQPFRKVVIDHYSNRIRRL